MFLALQLFMVDSSRLLFQFSCNEGLMLTTSMLFSLYTYAVSTSLLVKTPLHLPLLISHPVPSLRYLPSGIHSLLVSTFCPQGWRASRCQSSLSLPCYRSSSTHPVRLASGATHCSVTSLPDLWGLFTFQWVNPFILPPIYRVAIFFPLHGKLFEFGCRQLLCTLTSCAVVTALIWVWVQTVAVCIHVSCHCDHTCLHHCNHARSGPHTIAAMSIHDPFSCELCNCSHYFGFFCLSEQLFSSENCLFSLNIWYISSYVFFFWHISSHPIVMFFDISQTTRSLYFISLHLLLVSQMCFIVSLL